MQPSSRSLAQKLYDYTSSPWILLISLFSLLTSLLAWLMSWQLAIDPSWLALLLCGYPLSYLAFTRLVYQRWISSALLIVIAMFACIAVSEIFAAAEVSFIMMLGAWLEDLTVTRAQKGISELIELTPKQARLIEYTDDGHELVQMIDLRELKPGCLIRCLAGERIACDGVVVAGSSSVDQSVMTGESLPVDKAVGDEVFSGSLNAFGVLDIRLSCKAEDSSLARLIGLMKRAEEQKAPLQRTVDKWAVYLVPIALALAVIGALINLACGVNFYDSCMRGITVLVVFCPCALALATPVSLMAAIGQAAKKSVIIKSGAALEALAEVKGFAFDKTGTLTTGLLSLQQVVPADGYSGRELLSMAYQLEYKSEHPLAKALLSSPQIAELLDEGLRYDAEAFCDWEILPGQGVAARDRENRLILAGNRGLLDEHGIQIDPADQAAYSTLQQQGYACVLIARQGEFLGFLGLSDELKPQADKLIQCIQSEGLSCAMISGDSEAAVSCRAAELGLEHYIAECKPEDKLRIIQGFQKKGHTVCMVGDGVNDAPALRAAQLSVVMGALGSDIAMSAADIGLMSDELSKLWYVRTLAKACLKTIKVNITLSMLINALAIALSLLGVLNPVTGALVHNAGSVLVVFNAALLYDRSFKTELD